MQKKPAGAIIFLFSKEFSKTLKMTTLLKKNKKIKTLKPLRLKGFRWSCYPDSNWGPHPYQAALELFSNYFSYFIAIYTPICLLSATF